MRFNFIQKFTLGRNIILPGILTGLSYGILWSLLDQSNFILKLFYQHGIGIWICPLLTFLFFIAMVNLILFKYPKLKEESRLLNIPETIEKINDKNLILIKRIENLQNATSRSDAFELMSNLSDIDNDIMESGYNLEKFLVWVIPVLGFIGTVLGLSAAMGDFDIIIKKAESLPEIKANIDVIFNNLGMAFNTTLLALFMSAIVMFTMSIIRKKEGDFLTAVDEYCIKNILNKIPADSQRTDRIGDPEKLIQIIHQNQLVVEGIRITLENLNETLKQPIPIDIYVGSRKDNK